MMTTAEHIESLGQEYDSEPAETCDELYGQFVDAVLSAIRGRCPSVKIDDLGGSLGSQYFALALPGRESVEIRISNHRAGIGGETVPEWSFETQHRAKLHEMGLQEVSDAIHAAAEIIDD